MTHSENTHYRGLLAYSLARLKTGKGFVGRTIRIVTALTEKRPGGREK